MRRVSKKREAALRIYTCQRKRFLAEHPRCEICAKRASDDVHHTHGRLGANYLDEMTWLAVCRTCHEWIHSHPREAREKHWLA